MTQSGSPPPDDDEPSLGAVFVRNGDFLVVAARLDNALVTRVSELVNAVLDVCVNAVLDVVSTLALCVDLAAAHIEHCCALEPSV